ncbi:MAG: NfeD family protein [Cyclobacteriaceae bacterium]
MWLAIIILLIVGILLLLTEFIFIPGATVFGVAGLLLTGAGVVLAFINFGSGTGFSVLGVAFLCLTILLIVSLRSGTWEKLSLKSSSTSRVNDEVKNNLWKGDKGITLSALRPSGKAEFKDVVVEVSTMGHYTPAGTEVRIVNIVDQKIYVEPINS